jgi:TonB-linked SusC/RagA family outer membrane protein
MVRKIHLITGLLLLFITGGVSAQTVLVKGVVVDTEGTALPGLTVSVKNSSNGVVTSLEGKYAISNVLPSDTLVFSYIGFETQMFRVNQLTEINVIMKEAINELEELTVVAFQKQKKESVIGSITTISSKELKVPQANLTTALAGKMAGIIAYQRSGEPGRDNADFFIRGVTTFGYKSDPLILIDGLEVTKEDLARLEPDNVESFSIMKDATATALYGARGANGVVLVTTKVGRKGKMAIAARVETMLSYPTKINEFLDGVTYMEMYNQALRMRDPNAPLFFSKDKIEGTRRGDNPELYPNVDWYSDLFNDYAQNYKANISASGGGDIAQYYLSVAYTNEKGVLKVDPLNNFNNNIDIQRFNVRANVNFNFTKTTKGALKMYQLYDVYNGPITEASDIFAMVMQANPVNFPKYYEKTGEFADVKHTLFGNKGSQGSYPNPYAQMVRGYKDRFSSTNQAQFAVEQDLGMLTRGLTIRALASTNVFAQNTTSRYFNPFYYTMQQVESEKGLINRLALATEGSETLTEPSIGEYTYSSIYFEGAMQYDRLFAEKHSVGALLVGTARQGLNEYRKESYIPSNVSSTIITLPSRNLGLAGRLTYAFDSRYFLEANFGYNGSEKFSKQNQFGFFPSIGLGWLLSNEHFYSEDLRNIMNQLKLKYTYGLVGNDAISNAWDRFYYLSDVARSGYGYTWGAELPTGYTGYTVTRYANPDISWEISEKANYGLELGFFDKLNIQVDYFTENRSKIYMEREYIPKTMGLTADISSNIGKAKSRGIDGSIDFQWIASRNFWLTSRVNFTYSTNEYVENGEPDYIYPYLSHIGQPIKQTWGLVAERLFTDFEDIRNSPVQFGAVLNYAEGDPYLPGDIKYVDINKDGKIDDFDVVPIGYPTVPEIIYGFGASMGWKDIDFSFFFQGSGRSSFFINPATIAPFVGERNALQVIADDYWSYDNPDPHAFWPRMSTQPVENNNRLSTWWLRDGSFLRLKSLEAGYTVPGRKTARLGISGLRFYFSGTNLFCLSDFKLWDPEMADNGMQYPTQRVYNIGLQFSF